MPVDVVKWLQILCVEKLFLEHVIYIINRRLIIATGKLKCIRPSFLRFLRGRLNHSVLYKPVRSPSLLPNGCCLSQSLGDTSTRTPKAGVGPPPHSLPRAAPRSAPARRCGHLGALPGTVWSVRIRCHPEVLDASDSLSLWLSISGKTQADNLVTLAVTAPTRLPKQGP